LNNFAAAADPMSVRTAAEGAHYWPGAGACQSAPAQCFQMLMGNAGRRSGPQLVTGAEHPMAEREQPDIDADHHRQPDVEIAVGMVEETVAEAIDHVEERIPERHEVPGI